MNALNIKQIKSATEGLSIQETLSFLVTNFPGEVAFSTSFGQEDQAITHTIFENDFPVRVFTLDTGRLFQETYNVFSRTVTKYQKNIETYAPQQDKVQELVGAKGPNSFYNSVEERKECCFIRKIEPLKRALKGTKIWITGLRAEQSENRSGLTQFTYDEGFDVIKYNPLINWTLDQLEDFLDKNAIPQNVLHKKGFPSIGCMPCTRAIQPGEDIRAGRWWWEETKKECGLHK